MELHPKQTRSTMPIAAQYPGSFLEIAFEYTLEITLWIFGGIYYDK